MVSVAEGVCVRERGKKIYSETEREKERAEREQRGRERDRE